MNTAAMMAGSTLRAKGRRTLLQVRDVSIEGHTDYRDIFFEDPARWGYPNVAPGQVVDRVPIRDEWQIRLQVDWPQRGLSLRSLMPYFSGTEASLQSGDGNVEVPCFVIVDPSALPAEVVMTGHAHEIRMQKV